MHKAKNKRTGEYVALKRILMHNEKEGVRKIHGLYDDIPHVNTYIYIYIDSYNSNERNQNFEAITK